MKDKPKVVLIHPPAVAYQKKWVHLIRKQCCWAHAESLILPHELFTIGSTIADIVDVVIYDPALLKHNVEQAIQVLKDNTPDYIIIHSCIFDDREKPFLKQLSKLKIKVILISAPIYYADELKAQYPFAELVVNKDPEATIYKYFRNELKLPPLEKEFTFADIPAIDWQLFAFPNELKLYRIVYEINRGCKYNCQFCLLGTLPYIHRPAETVINDLYWLSKLREVKFVEFECSQITTDLEWIKRFSLLKKQFGLDFEFNTTVKANEITDEKIKLLSEAGMVSAYMGIDSINPIVMKSLGKNINISQIETAIEIMKKYNMNICCSTMFNLGETDEDVDGMLEILRTINLPRTRSGVVNVYKDTPLWRKHKDNLIYRPQDDDCSYNDKLQTLPDYANAVKRQLYFQEHMDTIYNSQLRKMTAEEIIDHFHIKVIQKRSDGSVVE